MSYFSQLVPVTDTLPLFSVTVLFVPTLALLISALQAADGDRVTADQITGVHNRRNSGTSTAVVSSKVFGAMDTSAVTGFLLTLNSHSADTVP